MGSELPVCVFMVGGDWYLQTFVAVSAQCAHS